MVRALVLALSSALLASSLAAQRLQASIWPTHAWWTAGAPNVLEMHPTAHFLGGAMIDVAARGPWIAKGWRDTWWKRLGWVTFAQGAWEGFQVVEIHGYTWKSAAWDMVFAWIGAGAVEMIDAIR